MKNKTIFLFLCTGVFLGVLFWFLRKNDSLGTISEMACMVYYCPIQLYSCFSDAECRGAMSSMGNCFNNDTETFEKQMKKYAHTQNPDDLTICILEVLGDFPSEKMGGLMECGQKNQCTDMEPYIESMQSDECVADPKKNKNFKMDFLDGTWWKTHANSWDIWDCQKATFWFNETEKIWKQAGTYRTYPAYRSEPHDWKFYEDLLLAKENDLESFRTELYMYGIFTREKWHIIDFEENDFFLIYVCAMTPDYKKQDSILLVLSKTKEFDETKLERMKKIATENGIEWGKMIKIDNTKC